MQNNLFLIILDLKYSQNNEGDTKLKPIDWHIDTGNYCNGGCIMCSPYWSSSLAKEFMNNGLAQEMPRRARPATLADEDDRRCFYNHMAF